MNEVSCAEIFVFRADLTEFADCSSARKKKAVSEIARDFVTAHVSQVTEIPAAKIEYLFNSHGKPYIAGNPLYFNVSHCGSIIAAAFCTEQIGVDIEFVRDFSDAVVRRYFTDDEKSYIDGSKGDEQSCERFFEIWTAKEAFLKFCGVGISGGFDFSTATDVGLRDRLYSPKLGSANIIHYNDKIKIFSNDIYVKNVCCEDDGNAKYCLSVCGNGIDCMNFCSR